MRPVVILQACRKFVQRVVIVYAIQEFNGHPSVGEGFLDGIVNEDSTQGSNMNPT
jgi:hypothetical protein